MIILDKTDQNLGLLGETVPKRISPQLDRHLFFGGRITIPGLFESPFGKSWCSMMWWWLGGTLHFQKTHMDAKCGRERKQDLKNDEIHFVTIQVSSFVLEGKSHCAAEIRNVSSQIHISSYIFDSTCTKVTRFDIFCYVLYIPDIPWKIDLEFSGPCNVRDIFWCRPSCFLWEFQDPKIEVLYAI